MTEEKTPPKDPPMLVVEMLPFSEEHDRMVERIKKFRQDVLDAWRDMYDLTPAKKATVDYHS